MDNFCRNKYINSYTLNTSIHIFKSLQIRYVYDVWNSTEWKWQQIPPQSHWEILCQLLENCPVSWGSAWQCFLPHRSASLSAGRWSNYQLGGGARREKGSKKRGKKNGKSIPSQDFKSWNCWQTLMKLPTSFLVRNPTQAGMTSKHNLNGNVFKIYASPCLSYPAVTRTQLYMPCHTEVFWK